ncbi:FliA/WhiG family RNA polymerase sigma factor [Neobacillus sp. MM2021_6]|uniref:sigma-70 family RNA polymerase sigma factor n=1 Tax=Bacillaceae TaxID=186817 RepID=UPI0014085366|nr:MULTISPECIES: FliA/WhiG family RNA polymerase sigma factor [Bacillaceae]MBO0961076.1 FliA/WhiG family RNA polymerase sigma factor [Neobacillus sp. MM2021_6]NHC20670.1 FliA/WhiG family RNA polymerase sigma factor [Bacillus sp. MM2020_4]
MKSAINETVPHQLLWRTYQEKPDSLTQEKLVKQYTHLVERVANRLSMSIPQRIIPKEDLISLGYIGLLEAINHFDYRKGYQFETYGLWRIKGAMLDGIRKMDWIPRGLREKAKKLNNAFRDLEQSLMRTPTEEEIGHYLNISADEVDQTMAAVSFSTLLSLDEPMKNGDEDGKQQNRLDQLQDDQSPSQELQMQKGELQKLIALFIDTMPKNERLVLTLFYFEGLSQVEIADVLNLTKGRISQIHSKAILRLRQGFEKKGYSFHSFV